MIKSRGSYRGSERRGREEERPLEPEYPAELRCGRPTLQSSRLHSRVRTPNRTSDQEQRSDCGGISQESDREHDAAPRHSSQ